MIWIREEKNKWKNFYRSWFLVYCWVDVPLLKALFQAVKSKKIFPKVAAYLCKSIDTSFSSIGHCDGKLYNFFTSLGSKVSLEEVWRWGEKLHSLKVLSYSYKSNDNLFSSIRHCDGKLFNFSTFLDIFWTIFGVKWAPKGRV